jgi:hypothetical protein
MSLARRDFMKLFGVSVASVLLTRCRSFPFQPVTTCYAPLPPPTVTPPAAASSHERLRQYWLRFEQLASQAASGDGTDYSLAEQMMVGHHAALDDLVAQGEISASVAGLVQEAYEAATYHVWRSNVPVTCYEPMLVDYAPASAGVLVRQAEVLEEIAAQGTIDPLTLEKAQTALEHDLAFYALSEAEVQSLYERLLQESQQAGQPIPSFEALSLALTPDARAAAQFIVDLLTGQ